MTNGRTNGEQPPPPVLFERRDALAIIRFNRPSERNPLAISTLEELERIVPGLASRADISTIIFTGTENVFASGAHIRELRALRTTEAALEFARRGQRVFQTIADAPQLTVAAINGYCMGGGLDLALSCKYRIASPRAAFAHPGARLGIITGWGGTQRLPRLIGAARALEMFATARVVTGEEAYEMGLVDRLSDAVLEEACALASRQVAGRSSSGGFTF